MAINKKSRIGISVIILIFITLVVVFGYNYIYQDHRNIETEQATFSLSANEISAEFSKNLEASEKKYLNKTVEIYGLITELNTMDLTLNDNVYCAFSTPFNTSYNIDSEIKIKGRCIGYDDLLEQVKLDQCSIVN
ncbi:OB-fold protein [Flavivirga spongiicola]|uniref:OB-fold putative lipoprotein n=1 Tax=Flavivirga spongiicola TaxID=421621 RepID=A0ABU7XPK3_9FLAO|nr:hypothetical protein [Flavivirga sp. MEBiC05379]MDO5977691.1 hypothetical protein [Flavivirga sp. MEBiC05379]